MALPIRRKGTLSTQLRDMQDELRRLRPQRGPGVLTSVTPGGVVRKAPLPRLTQPGTSQAYWA